MPIDPNIIPFPPFIPEGFSEPDPFRGAGEPGGSPGPGGPGAFLPPVVPFPVPGVEIPPPISIPPAPPATTPPSPGFGALIARVGLPTAIGAIAIELLERIAGELQAREFRELEELAEAEIRMIRGRIEIKERTRELEVERELELETEGGMIILPPTRTPGLSEIPQFPFPDPADEPLGDDPLPPEPLPGIRVIIVPIGDPIEAPVVDPTPEVLPEPLEIPAPSIPVPEPIAAPTTRPSTPTRPSTRPSTRPAVRPFVLPTSRPSVRPTIRPITTPIAQPRTPVEIDPRIDDPFVPLTDPRTTSVPSDLAGRDQCAPCAKADEEPEEPRTECFKKLVKESRFPSLDESFNWVEISCETGKEIR